MKGVPPFADFALRLNDALDSKGYPPKGEGRQNSLAKRMTAKGHKVTARGARKWLEGKSLPRMPALKVLAVLTGTDVGHLVGGSVSDVAESAGIYAAMSKDAKLIAHAYDRLPKEVQWLALSLVQMLATLTNDHHTALMKRLADAAAIRDGLRRPVSSSR